MILLTCNETWQKWCLQAKIGRWRGYERRRSGLCVSIPNDVRQTTAFVSPIDKDRARSKVRWSATTLATLQRSLLISSHLSTPCRPPPPLTIVVKNLFAGTRFPHHTNYPPTTLSRGLKSSPGGQVEATIRLHLSLQTKFRFKHPSAHIGEGS